MRTQQEMMSAALERMMRQMQQVEQHPTFFATAPVCAGPIPAGLPLPMHAWRGTLSEWFEGVDAAVQAVQSPDVSATNRAEAEALLTAAAGVYVHLRP